MGNGEMRHGAACSGTESKWLATQFPDPRPDSRERFPAQKMQPRSQLSFHGEISDDDKRLRVRLSAVLLHFLQRQPVPRAVGRLASGYYRLS